MSTLQLFDKVPDVGTTVRLERTFETSVAPFLPVDPLTVLLRVKDPADVETFHYATREVAGQWFVDFEVPIAGQWRYRWESTDPDLAVEGSFVVRKSLFGDLGEAPPPSDAWGASAWGAFSWPGIEDGWSIFPWGGIPWGG